MNRRQRKKKGLPVRSQNQETDACAPCLYYAECWERGRMRCMIFKTYEGVVESAAEAIRRLNEEAKHG